MAQIILDSANNLIQGDFDTATLSQRTRMQTSTVNATTGVYVVPNGSATSASVQVSNAADPTNASKVVVATNGSTDTQIVSGANGTGTYLPLSFYTNNDIRFQMGTAGQLNVRTAPGTVSSGSAGQFLTSGGPAAGVSWTTVTVPPSGQLQATSFTSPGTFTVPASTTAVKVTVIGGGGGGSQSIPAGNGGGGSSGITVQYITGITSGSSIPVTVGSGGGGGSTGGTSSIGPFGPGGTVSQTGGGAGSGVSGGTGSAGGGFGVGGANGLSGSGPGGTPGTGNSLGGNKLFLSTGGSASGPGTPAGSGTIGGGGGGGNPNFGYPAGSGGAGLIVVEYVG